MTDPVQRQVESLIEDLLRMSPGPLPVDEVLDRIVSAFSGGRVEARRRLELATAFPHPVCAIRHRHVLLPEQAGDARLVGELRLGRRLL